MLRKRLNHYKLHRVERYKPTKGYLDGRFINVVDACTYLHGYQEIFEKGIYEFQCSTNEPFIIDCGANIGLATLFFKNKYPNSKIIAFEPDSNICKTLKENIEIFNYNGVEIVEGAIWTKNDTIEFQLEGGFSGRIPKEGDYEKIVKVKSYRLKDFLTKKVDFLKIDIEGAEYEVISDCEDVLHHVDNIYIEYHSHIQEEQKLHEILKVLSNNKFRYHIKEEFTRKNPFVDNDTMLNMDLQLSIFGYRK